MPLTKNMRTTYSKFNSISKKSQLSIFVIISLIIVLGVISVIVYSKYSGSVKQDAYLHDAQAFSSAVKNLNSYIDNCLDKTLSDAISNVSIHGGYVELKNIDSYQTEEFSTAYYIDSDTILKPTKHDVEREIELYINKNIGKCLANLSAFTAQGIGVNVKKPESKVVINSDSVAATLVMETKVTPTQQTQQSNTISQYYVRRETPLGKMLDLANDLVLDQMQEPDLICLDCIYDRSKKANLIVQLVDRRKINNTYVFTIFENASDPRNEFIFANRYNTYSCTNLPLDDTFFLDNCLEQLRTNLTANFNLTGVADMNATVGKVFSLQIEAVGKNLTYSDYSELFDINNRTGKIIFLPNASMVGNHNIWIKVSDYSGRQITTSFNLNISANSTT